MSEPTWASYSSLSSHRACPQKWFYGHVRHLVRDDPYDVPAERDFGSWWHMLRAADSIQRGRLADTIQEFPKRLRAVDGGPTIEGKAVRDVIRVDVLGKADEWWRNHTTPEYRDEFVTRLGEPLLARLEAVDARWREQWGDNLATEHPLAVELRWQRLLPRLPGDETSPDVMLIGYVDEVYYDQRRHLVVARDHKAHKALATQTTADDMMDSQLQLYAWGASPTVTRWSEGRWGGIRATAYDRVRMAAPKKPWVTKAGNLSKQVNDYDLFTYEQGWGVAVGGRDRTPLAYEPDQAEIERLSAPAARSTWFQRTLTPLNTNLIRTHLRAAVDTAHDMARTRERSEASGEAGRNLSSGCRWCDFVGLCRAEMVGGPGGDYDLSLYKLSAQE